METVTPLQDVLVGICDLYRDNLNEHGATSKSVGWRDVDSQQLRFEKLAMLLADSDDHDDFTCNDWGCGYGAMFHFLRERFAGKLTNYYGYDICDEMLNEARRGAPGQDADFLNSPLPTIEADYTFVSGTFNVKLHASDAAWQEYVEQTLLKLWQTSRRGIAFNLLTSYVDWREDQLFYADPAHFFDFCKRRLSRFVSVHHDYPLYEWTMIVRRGG